MNGMLYNGISWVIGFLQLWVLKRKILAKNQHAQRKLHIVFCEYNEPQVPKSDLQSQFSRIIQIILIVFSIKNNSFETFISNSHSLIVFSMISFQYVDV